MYGPRLLLIRHGQTEWSPIARHAGRTDIPLTDAGRTEAVDARRALEGWNLVRAYSSPLLEEAVLDDMTQWGQGRQQLILR